VERLPGHSTPTSWKCGGSRRLSGLLAGARYRLETRGIENLPKRGFLLVANHVTHFDFIVLQLACPRPIRFVAVESICRHPWLTPLLGLVDAGFIPISNGRAKDGIRKAVEHINKGGIVCIFPEGELSLTGALSKLKKGYELIARLAECDVVAAWLSGLNESVFSFDRSENFLNELIRSPLRATIAFGRPISARLADHGRIRQEFVELSEFCFRTQPELDIHLGRAAVESLKRHQLDDAIVDGANGQRLRRGDLLAISIALSRWIKRHCPGERVALVLPPGVGALVANIAVTLANKAAGNVHLTAGATAFGSAIDGGEISNAISCKSVMKRCGDFSWPERVFQLEELMDELKPKILFWRIASFLMPAQLLCDLLGLPRKSDRKEAVLFFSSDEARRPETIITSDRNVMSGVVQLGSLLKRERRDSLLVTPSFYHSFGCTVGFWYPVIEGVKAVTYSDSVDITTHLEVIKRHKITFLVTTPDLIRRCLKRSNVGQFASVKLIVAGPEQLPAELAEAFKKKSGKHILEGYWLAEAVSPVSVNRPEPAENPYNYIQPTSRMGSAGKLLPGMAAQIRNSETGRVLSPHERGTLWLKGAALSQLQVDESERTQEAFGNGWVRTGELARFDEDGFLYIQSRVANIANHVQPETEGYRIMAH
jgi:acyl-[acyl-carrier-protein]-phospholipid O-acyltransferase / long-chain-fatty-acid--[acyl-carrier-protein] ligase